MRKIYISLFILIFYGAIHSTKAQNISSDYPTYTNFPIIVGVTFQNFALPFRDLKSNFSHVGFSLGTEIGLNKKKNLVQQIQAMYYFNKEMGNGFAVYTQTIYRPRVYKYFNKTYKYFYTEIKVGLGWQRIYHPVDTYKFKNGNWEKTIAGKSQLIIPFGISIGHGSLSSKTHLSPFITYQVIPALFYNDTVPLNFYSLFQLGTRIHLNYQTN